MKRLGYMFIGAIIAIIISFAYITLADTRNSSNQQELSLEDAAAISDHTIITAVESTLILSSAQYGPQNNQTNVVARQQKKAKPEPKPEKLENEETNEENENSEPVEEKEKEIATNEATPPSEQKKNNSEKEKKDKEIKPKENQKEELIEEERSTDNESPPDQPKVEIPPKVDIPVDPPVENEIETNSNDRPNVEEE